MKQQVFQIFLSLCFVGFGYSESEWSYQGSENGLERWGQDYETCRGMRQSGVNIITANARFDDQLEDFEIITDRSVPTVTVKNNGHSVILASSANIQVAEGGLPGAYEVHSAHFHWGKTNGNGSEHQIDGKSFPIEMHIVTFNKELYADLASAVLSADGNALAVIGVQFQLDTVDNPLLKPITDKLSEVINAEAKVELEDFDIMSLLPQDTFKFYRYDGSLTTPPCSEVVIWTVMKIQQTISEAQLNEFRQLVDSHREVISDNWRPVQLLNGRYIYKSFIDEGYDYVTLPNAGQMIAPWLSATFILSSMLSFVL